MYCSSFHSLMVPLKQNGSTMKLSRSCNLTAFIHSSTGPVVPPFASCHEGPGFNFQGGNYVKLGFSCQHCLPTFFTLKRLINVASSQAGFDPNHHQAVNLTMWIIPLHLTQLFCPSFMLAAGPPSSFTTDTVAAGGGGELYGEPAISLHSYTVPLVQWFTRLLPVMRDPGSIPRGYLCETGILLSALSRYKIALKYRFLKIVTNISLLCTGL